MFVHGFLCSHEDWRFQLTGLLKTHEVVACDLRGHGETPGRPQECSIEHFGGDVAALVNNLELPNPILVGHSMGCRVVLEANRLAPERIAGIVLVDGSRAGSGDPDAAEAAARAPDRADGLRGVGREPLPADVLQVDPGLRAPRRARRAPERRDRRRAVAAHGALGRGDARAGARRGARAGARDPDHDARRAEGSARPMQAGQSSPWLDLLKKKLAADAGSKCCPASATFRSSRRRSASTA